MRESSGLASRHALLGGRLNLGLTGSRLHTRLGVGFCSEGYGAASQSSTGDEDDDEEDDDMLDLGMQAKLKKSQQSYLPRMTWSRPTY